MELATILTIVVLNILQPSADVFSDMNLAVKLYQPKQPGCKYFFTGGIWSMQKKVNETCRQDRVSFCSKNENRQYCFFDDYTDNMATVLLMPCLLNYIVCFYTFFRLTTNRKRYTFIFPLLNLYPQYGKTHSS